jgi:hypothetical protein
MRASVLPWRATPSSSACRPRQHAPPPSGAPAPASSSARRARHACGTGKTFESISQVGPQRMRSLLCVRGGGGTTHHLWEFASVCSSSSCLCDGRARQRK